MNMEVTMAQDIKTLGVVFGGLPSKVEQNSNLF